MALAFRVLCRNSFNIRNITKPVKWSVQNVKPIKFLASGICYRNDTHEPLAGTKCLAIRSIRLCSTQGDCKPPKEPEPEKKGLIQKLKIMYRDYWYVVVPVHIFTSAIWYGSFYYAVRSGVDVIAILQSLGISETIISPLRESAAGYFALALALYKVATPLRYAVTVGATTFAIKKLQVAGWIKPVPSKKRMKEMFHEKKDNFQECFKESKQHYQTQMKQKHGQIMDEMRRYKCEMRNIKNKVKKT